MRRELIGGPLDGMVVPIPEKDLEEELHFDIMGFNKRLSVHVYVEDEETGNYKYQGDYKPEDLYYEEENEDE